MNTDQILRYVQSTWGTADFDNTAWEVQDWWQYDSVGYAAAGTTEIIYFAVPAGQNDPVLGVTKRKEHTNMQQAGQMGGTDVFVLSKVRIGMWNYPRVRQTGTSVSTDTSFSARQLLMARFMSDLMMQGVFTFKIMNKDWLVKDQPWQTFAQGYGMGDKVVPSLATVNGGANAVCAPSKYDIWEVGDTWGAGQPVVFAPSTPFTTTINFPLGASPSSASIYGTSSDQPATFLTTIALCGFKIRPRQ